MAKMWYKLILAGEKTLEDVPARYRDEVKKLLGVEEGTAKKSRK